MSNMPIRQMSERKVNICQSEYSALRNFASASPNDITDTAVSIAKMADWEESLLKDEPIFNDF
jgi:hypothetical protein